MESFFQNVYQVVNLIPKGRVTTYGAIAKYLGAPKSARMVGWALNKVSIGSKIPRQEKVDAILDKIKEKWNLFKI